ncbi:MAG TPA: beta-agarase [Planctomycetota bacterium]
MLSLLLQALIDFSSPTNLTAWDAKSEVVDGRLRVRTGGREPWAGVTLKGAWDLSRFGRVSAHVANTGAAPLTLGLRVDNAGADGTLDCVFGEIELAAGAKGVVTAEFRVRVPAPPGFAVNGMHAGPGNRWGTIDPAKVTQFIVYVARGKAASAFEVDDLRAGGEAPIRYAPWKEPFLPFIDELGQDIHRDWPGKATAAELPKRVETWDAGPKGWNRWGGWADGPALEATGFFRTAKREGKWWLVDPDGRLFFSHGIDCVATFGSTPVDERPNWFRGWPAKDDPEWKEFYHPAAQVVHGSFKGRRPLCFNITAANLKRRYGPDWKAKSEDVAHRRLRAWGLNTLGNWSDEGARLGRRTPYVVAIHWAGPWLRGSGGHWQPFRDVFDPAFARDLRAALPAQIGASAGDPWCLGYFVDNEISWGNETSLAEATLRSPPAQRKPFLDDLRAKYPDIAALNAAWRTSFASWDAVGPPPEPNADLRAFNARIAEAYFSQTRAALKEVAPKQLYLGCRFAEVNPLVAAVAAKHADVVSFNVYKRSPAESDFAGLKDVPLLIGEFHFGALDRGPFNSALVGVRDQAERGRAYQEFLRAALRDPRIVGAHWFQYRDEPATGRELDGENFQCGFVDITDTPYPETVAAARAIGDVLYVLTK